MKFLNHFRRHDYEFIYTDSNKPEAIYVCRKCGKRIDMFGLGLMKYLPRKESHGCGTINPPSEVK